MKTLLSLSGGLDSATLLGFFKEQGDNVTGVSFTYGSKHNVYENEAAGLVAKYYDIELIEMDITSIMLGFKSDLLKSGGDIPEGHYKAENMESTVVPARNMIFISIMTGLAISMKMDKIGIGVHAGDHYIYPDCRPAFIQSMNNSIIHASEKQIRLKSPFLFDSKAKIIERGLAFKKQVPFELTRTCYKDQLVSCGVCGSCVERLEAFKLNEIKDPIKYEK